MLSEGGESECGEFSPDESFSSPTVYEEEEEKSHSSSDPFLEDDRPPAHHVGGVYWRFRVRRADLDRAETLPVRRRFLQISVRVLDGPTVVLCVLNTDEVRIVKEMLLVWVSIPVAEQLLLYAGRVLEDDRRVVVYDIHDGSVLELVQRIRGEEPRTS
ncbi:MAG: hypothetical protein GY938_00700 [Ketobacter sp.]|nr:hypothetical protein [Ketobacter sp.]